LKKKNIIIGYTTGVFDLFHIGHLNILKKCKNLCDKLIVGVSKDNLVLKYKNKYPVIKETERLKIVESIKYVDHAIYQSSLDKFVNFKKYKFDMMFVGDDWYNTKKWKELDKKFKLLNVKIIYLPYTKSTSSTKINNILNLYRK
jgi:glycerol-3-phosphate cytidylyltransferase